MTQMTNPSNSQIPVEEIPTPEDSEPMSDEIRVIMAKLAELPQIKLRDFEIYAAALADPSDDPESLRLRTEWARTVCISERLAVHVVDDTSGEIMFRVPPMRTPLAQLENKNITSAMLALEKMQRGNPYAADAFAREVIEPSMFQGMITLEDTKDWQYIIQRYGSNQPQAPDGVERTMNTNAIPDEEDLADDDGW